MARYPDGFCSPLPGYSNMILKSFTIAPEAAGIRLDKFIRLLMPDLQESALRKLFSSRDVKLDGHPASRDAVLVSGQLLQIYLPGSRDSLRIVYEDPDILLVNKPAGISVEPDSRGGVSLSELCRLHVEASGPVDFPPSPCHRLDNKTSGLCLFAKNSRALDILLEVFRNRTLEKEYVCLVRGMMKPSTAVCTAYLIKDSDQARVRVLDHPVPGGRKIITAYETMDAGPVSRLKVHLITGRTHQIRAHLAALGHPILGDEVYGDRSFNRLNKARNLKLCAVSLTLETCGKLPSLDHRRFEINPPF